MSPRTVGLPLRLIAASAAVLIILLTIVAGWLGSMASQHANERLLDDLSVRTVALRDALSPGVQTPESLLQAARSSGLGEGLYAVLDEPPVVAGVGRALGPQGLKLSDLPEVAVAQREGMARGVLPATTGAGAALLVILRDDRTTPPRAIVAMVPAFQLTDWPAYNWIEWGLILGATAIAILALALGLQRLWGAPLQRILATAQQLSEAQLAARVEVGGASELALLARSVNQIGARWAGDIRTIDRQRSALASLLDQLHEGVIVARPDARISLINPAALRLLSISAEPQQFVGLPVERCIPQLELLEMLTPPPHGREGLVRADDSFRLATTPEQEQRIQIETPDGLTHLLARAADVVLPEGGRFSDGASVGRVLVLTDITQFTRALQIKTDFVASASHELRTPLTGIRGAVEALLNMDLARETADARHFIELIDRQTARLAALASDLLDLARLESGRGRFEPEWLGVNSLLGELRENFAADVEQKGLRWESGHVAEEEQIEVNPSLLRLVLDNLLDNAVKYTERGGQVRIGFARGDSAVELEVSDTGCGIPEAEQERVFERFYQVQRARSGRARGTGLGLSIVRHAVTTMGGAVSLYSRPGQGTRVTIRIPQK